MKRVTLFAAILLGGLTVLATTFIVAPPPASALLGDTEVLIDSSETTIVNSSFEPDRRDCINRCDIGFFDDYGSCVGDPHYPECIANEFQLLSICYGSCVGSLKCRIVPGGHYC